MSKGNDVEKHLKVYLTTPVRKTGYIGKTQVTENMVFAGETALSEKTMLIQAELLPMQLVRKIMINPC